MDGRPDRPASLVIKKHLLHSDILGPVPDNLGTICESCHRPPEAPKDMRLLDCLPRRLFFLLPYPPPQFALCWAASNPAILGKQLQSVLRPLAPPTSQPHLELSVPLLVLRPRWPLSASAGSLCSCSLCSEHLVSSGPQAPFE